MEEEEEEEEGILKNGCKMICIVDLYAIPKSVPRGAQYVNEPATIFLTSEFSYLLSCNPAHKT